MAAGLTGLVCEAHSRLFPGEPLHRRASVRFSGRFKPYNASVRWSKEKIEMRLSRSWEGVSEEILIGLFQELLLKVRRVKERPRTTNLRLYHHYLQSLHLAREEQHDADPLLLESFTRVNSRYFLGTLERPRLLFGQASRRTFGHYHYATDTVTLSTLLCRDAQVLDYVMYHELLHKHLKYEHSGQKTRYHTREFRELERQFAESQEMERRLRRLAIRGKTVKRGFLRGLF